MAVKVIIENSTKWQTRHLRAIAIRAIKGYYTKDQLTIRFVPSQGRHSGCAYLNSWSCTVRLPSPGNYVDNGQLAVIIAHEAAHCMGVDHRDMNRSYLELQWGTGWKERFGWAYDLPLEAVVKKKKEKPSGLPLAEKRHAYAVTNLGNWERKLKFAQNKVKKYRQKVAYYETRMAALKEKN